MGRKPRDPDDRRRDELSRRELLKRAGIVGATATFPVSMLPARQIAATAQGAFETLTAAESVALEAIVAGLIPTDGTGPVATEAARRPLHRPRPCRRARARA